MNDTKPATDNRAVKMKVNLTQEGIKEWEKVIKEYQTYEDRVNKWICANLRNKIGDVVLPYLEHYSDTDYYKICQEKKDEPLYKMFMKGFDSNAVNNALKRVVEAIDIDKYHGNMGNFTATQYREKGYLRRLFANYKTKMANLKPTVKKAAVNESSTDEEIQTQVIFEMFNKRTWSEPKDFKMYLDWQSNKETVNEKIISRMGFLYGYYKNHEKEVNEKIGRLCADKLIEYGGIKISFDKMSMTIQDPKFKKNQKFALNKLDGCAYNLHLETKTLNRDLKLFGNRQVIRRRNGELVELVDIINHHGEPITFTIETKKNAKHMYVVFSYEVDKPQKKTHDIINVVGVDVNTKHMLMQTSIKDNGKVTGFVNIYEALIANQQFTKYLTKSELKIYQELSKYVSFCPIETDLLFSRFSFPTNPATRLDLLKKPVNKLGEVEKYVCLENMFTETIDTLIEKCKDTDVESWNYLNYVKQLRAKYKAWYVLKAKYRKLHSQFDKEHNSEGLDKRQSINLFNQTEHGNELLIKMNAISQDIIGCRNNIINYAYNIFDHNGYDTVALEDLTTSQFEKTKSLISTTSLMGYHNLSGKPVGSEEYKKVITKNNEDYYNFEKDENGNIVNITLTEKGEMVWAKGDFKHQLIKVVNFASVKDKFIQLANKGKIQSVLVPAAYTSQIDSNTHCLYVKNILDSKTKKMKTVLVDGDKVRSCQEHHINGLNADINSALNIAYIVSTPEIRSKLCVNPKINWKKESSYNKPFLTASSKYPATIVKEYKDMGLTVLWDDKNEKTQQLVAE